MSQGICAELAVARPWKFADLGPDKKMGKIHKLPASVVNQIAAGEVVERPSSVVKELLENAVDSGATRIDLSVERGGKDLIRVADDGCGMDSDDLMLAFQAHATSKLLTAEDLEHITTLGFRGEALAAIAEISRTRCTTRKLDRDKASSVEIEGGHFGEIKAAAGSPGTVFEVRDLFFNTPVRRRFLKSDTTEAGHVAEAFQRVALARPGIQMTYRSGGKLVYDVPGQASLKERIGIFFGRELIEDLVWIDCKADGYHVWGYVAQPSHSRGSSRSQNFYVGGRYVRDRTLSHALTEAYRGLLMVGRQPISFLSFDIPPEDVDVNVHPAKVEVRFRDSQKLYALLLSAIRQKFLATDLHEKLSAHGLGKGLEMESTVVPQVKQAGGESKNETGSPHVSSRPAPPSGVPYTLSVESPSRQMLTEWFSNPQSNVQNRGIPSLGPPKSSGNSDLAPSLFQSGSPGSSSFQRNVGQEVQPTKSSWSMSETSHQPFEADLNDSEPAREARTEGQMDLVVTEQAPASLPAIAMHRKAFQIHDSYLVVETDDGVSLVDQHALHERILYEELRAKLQQDGIETQRLLIPEMLELDPADHALALEHAETLERLGFEVQDFGAPTLAILTIPLMAKHLSAGELTRNLIDRFHHSQAKPDPEAFLNLTLATIACKAAVKAGDKLQPAEIEALLAKGTEFAHSHHCPHGRPSALVFTKTELEKQFGRI
ncbi:MAG: DNA mismatch repair endonuclease MutL [Planctomycetota bacterium]